MEENKIHGNSKYHNILTKKYLMKHYYTDGMNWISKKLNIDRSSIFRYLKKYRMKIIKISQRGIKIKSKNFIKFRKSNIIPTWNKNLSIKEKYPERIEQMIKKLKGRRLNRKGEFKKGHKKSLKYRKHLICKHHIDLDKNNNFSNNLLYILNSDHNSLHKRAYDYLVENYVIEEYITWFIKKFNTKIYTIKDYYKQIRGKYGK